MNEMSAPRKRWPDAVTQSSDDCELTFGGESYYPHQGETVTYIPGLTVGAMLQITQLAKLAPRMEAMDKDTPQAESIAVMSEFGEIVEQMKDEIAGQIVAWSWTDRRGQPYAAPAAEPGVFNRLEIKELMYLGLLLRGESEGAQRKG